MPGVRTGQAERRFVTFRLFFCGWARPFPRTGSAPIRLLSLYHQWQVNYEAVRKIGLTFAGVEDSTSFGKPALKIGDKTFACIASHRSAEPGSLVVRIDRDRRAELLAEAPETYYITDHYAGYTGVLARLDKIKPEAIRGVLAGAIQFVRAEKKRR